MAILTRPRLLPQERFDLEDFEVLLSSLCSDAKFWTENFWADSQYILKGFTVSGLGGPSPALISVAGGTLINPNNSGDFSWFVGASGEPALQAALNPGVRNYLELELSTANATPLTRAFWDPTAQGGLGAEFNQTVETVTNLDLNVVVLTGGFSGSTDRVKLAIVDTDGANNITGILDRRDLLFRLGTPTDPEADYAWASQTEPELTLNISGVSGSFTVGETVTIGGSTTATVTTGGVGPIGVIVPNNDSFSAGDTVTGVDSGATATLDSFSDSFSGADKDIINLRTVLTALMTEFKRVKGSQFWFEDNSMSLAGIFRNSAFSILSARTTTAKYEWTGTHLRITDDSGAPAGADVIAALRVFNSSADLFLTRQDAASAPIALADEEVLWIELPKPIVNTTYDSVGAGASNYQVAARGSVPLSENTYWLAYREGAKLYLRGGIELEAGETAEISDTTSEETYTYIGSSGETDDSPVYTSNNAIVDGDNLTAAIGKLDGELEVVKSDNNQDRNTKLVGGGVWAWNDTTNELSFTADAYIESAGLNAARNTVQFSVQSPITLPDGEFVAYVDINRAAGATANLTVTVADIDTLGNTDDSRVIIAWRDGSGVIVGNHSMRLEDGESKELYSGLSVQNRTFIGAVGASDSTPPYTSDIRGVAAQGLTARTSVLTDAMGDEQEDRNSYFRSDDTLTWDGSSLSFLDDIVFHGLNKKSGGEFTATITQAQSPLALANNEVAYIAIDRTSNTTPTVTVAAVGSLPAQTQANKEIIILAHRKDTGGGTQTLHLPFQKQTVLPNTTFTLGITGLESANLGVPDPAANMLINGDFGIAQRTGPAGSTSVTSSTAYTVDRWSGSAAATGQVDFTHLSVASVTELASQYALKMERVSGTQAWSITQALETSDLHKVRGKTITFSVYLLKGAGLTADVNLRLYTTDIEAIGGASTVDTSTLNIPNASISSSTYTRFDISLAVPDNTVAGGLRVIVDVESQASAANSFLNVAQAMLNIGTQPADFRTMGKTLQQEFDVCYRYYQKGHTYSRPWDSTSATAEGRFLWARNVDGAGVRQRIYFHTKMRTLPSISIADPGTGTQGNYRDVTANTPLGGGSFEVKEYMFLFDDNDTGWNNTGDGNAAAFLWEAEAEL